MRKIGMVKLFTKTGLAWLWVSVALVLVDHFAKMWAINHLLFEAPMAILPILDFTLAYNTGAAFSFLDSASGWQHVLFSALAIVVSLVILNWLRLIKRNQRWLSIALCLILGGALGNVWDRLQFHYVIDFLSFHWGSWHFAIFNIADAGISVGAFMLFVHWLRE